MACTATATRSVKQEVVDTLEMKEYVEVIYYLTRETKYFLCSEASVHYGKKPYMLLEF